MCCAGKEANEKDINLASVGNVLDVLVATKATNFTFLETFENETTKIPLIEPEGSGSEAQEKRSSLAIFFILMVIVLATLLVHLLIVSKFHYIPESLAIVMLGAFIGFVLSYSERDWREVESFSPNFFFLVLLPPIIFESGYNLHKGDFFANIFPILTFAIIGTAVSAFVIGSSLYILGQADLIYRLSAMESFAFGSMISAVDPVATLAIFQALNVEPILYMLVFGESMLNDAVAIVLTSTALELAHPAISSSSLSTSRTLLMALYRFTFVFIVSAVLGAAIGFISALLFKHVDLRKTPSLEFALLLVFAYLPYGLAEAISLSGIMAILFCSITMSQYTHFNVSPVTQITMQQTFRTLAFVAETCTFAYLGMALFTIKLVFHPMFILWSILLCFIARALNVFPLSFIVNQCRQVQISLKNQFIMWFSGMRGAVAFALALHISAEDETTKRMLLTTTLCITLFTIIFLGGSTLPLMKILNELSTVRLSSQKRKRSRRRRERKRRKSPVLLSKTQEMFIFDHSEAMTSANEDAGTTIRSRHSNATPNAVSRFNERFVKPMFVRKFTSQEMMENRVKLRNLACEVLNDGGNNEMMHIGFEQSSSDELFGVATDPLLR
uniref:Sodium/hydrogen exchanger n=1 Tax=Anisakis simplex TaxID=6269 RepID=A0A346RVR4_ANISI|nr:sodium hydrogen exchanger 8 [Anisakis simplex]